jgi:two-component system NarL family sensor kinase
MFYPFNLVKSKSIFLLICLWCPLLTMAQGADKIVTKPDKGLQHLLNSGKDKVQKGQLDSAEILLSQASKEAKQQNNQLMFAEAEISIGRMHADKGENVVALEHYHDAITAAENIQNKKLIAHVYKNIGALYISWKKFDEALANYDKAEALAREIKEQELVADCQNNKGTVYEQQKKYSEAITAYKNALDLYTAKNITGKISMALSNVAIVYKYQKNYNKSLEYNKKALALSEKSGDKWMQAATYNNIGSLYTEMGQYDKCIENCKKSLSIANSINAIEIVESAYDSMSEASARAGDYKNAYGYRMLFSDVNSKFINTENTRQLAELNVKFETERKQKLILQQQFEISKKNLYLYGIFILVILGAAVTYLVIRNYKYEQGQRLQAQIYKQQEVANRALFEGEQKERIRIARDLHDSIGQMLSVVKMNLSHLSHKDGENKVLTGTMKLVDETVGEVRNISHNLIPEELNFGLFPALEALHNKVNIGGGTNVILDIDENAREFKFVRESELSIYRIVQEVLGNMMKHAQATRIDIIIDAVQDSMKIVIKDNGIGFDTSKIHQSEGIGWKNIAARVNMLDADLKVSSDKMTGTQVEINVPV